MKNLALRYWKSLTIIGSLATIGLAVGLGVGLTRQSKPTDTNPITFNTAGELIKNIITNSANSIDPYFLPTVQKVDQDDDIEFDNISNSSYDSDYILTRSRLPRLVEFFYTNFITSYDSDSNQYIWSMYFVNDENETRDYVLGLIFIGTVNSIISIGVGLPSNDLN